MCLSCRISCFLFFWLFLPVTLLAQGNLRLITQDAGLFDPARGPLQVDYILLKEANEIEVLIENFRGQVVDRLIFVELRAGDQKFSWTGLNDDGEHYPDGHYRFNIISRFADGGSEAAVVQFRIATIEKQERRGPMLAPLPPRDYKYKLDGSVSTFWRRNSEDPDHTENDGEQRVRAHFVTKTASQTVDGVFSARKPYSKETSYQGSQAWAEQRWQGGKVKGVLRQNLGSLDDPMKLFNDFRTERNKFGLRLDHHKDWVNVTALAFGSEGDVDTEERGMAGRLTFGPSDGLKVGISYTHRDVIPLGESRHQSGRAIAYDLRLPISTRSIILAEYVSTKNGDGVNDDGYILKAEHNSETIRIAAGYFDLGENFAADYANPIRQIRSDGKGIDANLDYRRHAPLWKFSNITMAWRGYILERHNDGAKVREGDCSLRGKLGSNDSLLISWLGREDDGNKSRNIMFSDRHSWNKEWSSSLQVNNNSYGSSDSWRWLVDTALRQQQNNYRMALEFIRRTDENIHNSTREETSVTYDSHHNSWGFQMTVRHTRMLSHNNTNVFSRLTYNHDLLHRYRFLTYIALGDRATLNTEEQIEVGLEITF